MLLRKSPCRFFEIHFFKNEPSPLERLTHRRDLPKTEKPDGTSPPGFFWELGNVMLYRSGLERCLSVKRNAKQTHFF